MRLRQLGCALNLLLAIACDSPAMVDGGAADDAGADSGAVVACERAVDCDDGLYCNGSEVCVDALCAAGAPPCDDVCQEAERRCVNPGCDADGDGHESMGCGGDDCDDADVNRFPGNAEVCDGANHDEDCDDRTFGIRDADGDGEPDELCCNGDNCGSDCDDSRAGVSPLATETCGDGVDNDCDGNIDEGVARTCYEDEDRDTFAAVGAATMMDCGCPAGWTDTEPVAGAADCNDDPGAGGAMTHPGATEVCDRLDNDCSLSDTEMLEEPGEDFDEDGHAPLEAECSGGFARDDCEDTHPLVHPGQSLYFARPFCPGACDVFVVVGRGWVCGAPCGKGDIPSFDFDCSGSLEFEAAHTNCRALGPGGCTPEGSPLECVGSGPVEAQSAARCGENLEYVECSCVPRSNRPLGGNCETSGPTTRRLPCR